MLLLRNERWNASAENIQRRKKGNGICVVVCLLYELCEFRAHVVDLWWLDVLLRVVVPSFLLLSVALRINHTRMLRVWILVLPHDCASSAADGPYCRCSSPSHRQSNKHTWQRSLIKTKGNRETTRRGDTKSAVVVRCKSSCHSQHDACCAVEWLLVELIAVGSWDLLHLSLSEDIIVPLLFFLLLRVRIVCVIVCVIVYVCADRWEWEDLSAS